MNISTFDLLRVAVDLARDQQIPHVDGLRSALCQKYPDRAGQIDEALSLWSAYERRQAQHLPSATPTVDSSFGRDFGQ